MMTDCIVDALRETDIGLHPYSIEMPALNVWEAERRTTLLPPRQTTLSLVDGREPIGRTDVPDTDPDADIRSAAYFIWLDEGCPDGRADAFWHRAHDQRRERAYFMWEAAGRPDGGADHFWREARWDGPALSTLLALDPSVDHPGEDEAEAPSEATVVVEEGVVEEPVTEPVMSLASVFQDAAADWLVTGQRQMQRNLDGMAKLITAASVQDVVLGHAELVTESVTQLWQDGLRIMGATQSAFRSMWLSA